MLAGLFLLGAEFLQIALVWAVAGIAAAAVLALAVWGRRRYLAHRREAGPEAPADTRAEADLDAVRGAMLEAVGTIRNSRLGRASGARALYELPWYMVIGNPAAGKSSAITQSGLQFPFADPKAIQGVGGTRQCDWFFTAEGILLDTAGRYAVQAVDREEWHGFLGLLKKHRPRAPINGIVIAVSIAELRGDDTESVMQLARSLRQRVQDLIEKLEVFAPVYVMFTKVDLVAGFADFFMDAETTERERPWGATMPFKLKAGCRDMLSFFEQSFDELCEGLREMGIATMSQRRRELVPAGVHTFPPGVRSFEGTVEGLPRHAVRRQSLPVSSIVPGLLLHQCAAGGAATVRAVAAGRPALRADAASRCPAHVRFGKRGISCLGYFVK
ncbi:type VI secretion protein IcmF/TssM N-terminal domain-containing protein [Massilia eburnea]|uniref:type VI secretion protein IcmF/TssM N-terminal domain-containing protein n=1 Tax=Massilia eburnea TaxID=1776165 RepID=UPI003D6B3C45